MATYLVWGLGKSGTSAVELLKEKKERVIEGDDARGDRWEEFIEETDTLVLSPGVPPSHPLWKEALRRDIEIIGELELAWRFFKGKAIAITGTDGKSTTTRLTYEILKRSIPNVYECGNTGTPFSDIVRKNGDCVAVLEVSSFQGKTLRTFRPSVGAFLNFSPDHLDWHPNIEDYLSSKRNIFSRQKDSDLFIAGSDQREVIDTPTMARKIRATELPMPFEPSEIPIRGRHNLINAHVASLIALNLGIEEEVIRQAVKEFKGLPMRMELIGRFKGIEIYNDSKSTTPHSLRAGLESFPDGSVILIAGGKDKGADFSIMREAVKRKVKCAVLIGETREIIREAIKDLCEVHTADNLKEAVDLAFKRARAGDFILFSPGCSSFDMFDSYVHRGEVFNRLVRDIIRSQDG